MPRIKPRKLFEKREILIGADPELFALDQAGNPVSVHNILPGTKTSPLHVPFGAVQVDGIAGEFNIQPAKKRSEFLRNIQHVRKLLEFFLKEQRPDLTLHAVPTVYLSQDYMNTLPGDVKKLGCEPDYNAYTGKMNPKPSQANLFRTGAGHIHIGWGKDYEPFGKEHFAMCCDLVKELDFVLYRASHKWDTDTTRMKLYGKPGAFRPKSYGVEYRVLSNAWLKNSVLQQYVYDATRAISELFFKGVRLSTQCGINDEEYYPEYKEFLEKNRIPIIDNYAFSV